MSEAKRDNNSVPTMLGVLNTDGTTPTNVTIDPSNNFLDVMNGTTGSDFGDDNASRDDNRVPTMMAVSETDGSTPVPLYVDSSGNLLIDST